MIRHPAVAGSFYEGTADRLERQLDQCFADGEQPSGAGEHFIGAVVPHAGLMYSGHVAASLYARVELPRRLIILCPNHTGAGHFAATQTGGAWRTPLGECPIDVPLVASLMAETQLIAEDARAHAREHSLEVQLPFIQRLRPDSTFAPLCLGAHRYDFCEMIGAAVARAVAASPEPVAILASSDLNHYEDQKTTLQKDQLAIDAVLALDPRRLWDTVERNAISMCGIIPTTTMLVAAKRLGATRATLVRHATSGDINGDYGHVVGYAAIVVA